MSSFADPYRRTTQVELGCKLTYLSDLEDPIDWTAFDDPENEDRTEEESRIVTFPIHASSLMNKCLQELQITANINPLTNKFSISTFSFSGGYVSILGDLLVSESYCGYLDENEVLQVFPLDQGATSGPVFGAADIVDLGPIGVGQLPGEAVTVSYSTLKLKPPEPPPAEDATPEEQEEEEERQARINWEASRVSTTPKTYYVNFVRVDGPEAGLKQVVTYSGSENTLTSTSYRVIRYPVDNAFVTRFATKEVVSTRVTEVSGDSITRDSATATDYAAIGVSYNNAYITLSYTIETFSYDNVGNQTGSTSYKYEPEAFVLSSVNFDHTYPASETDSTLVAYSGSFALTLTEFKSVTTENNQDYSREITSTYLKQSLTQNGQQAIATYREDVGSMTLSEAETLASYILFAPLVHENTVETVNRTGASTVQERPSAAQRTNSYYAKGGNPNNGWRTESRADLELALGSATAQRRIELSMPYAPDDTFIASFGGSYLTIPSDAPAKANRYGRVQNRLLLGNRNGISLQLTPEKLPAAPYSPLYVEANGLTAMYRANGTNWAFDSNGIVASVDALFWAAVGGTGVFWFPVAPGIVTLPSSPTVIDTSPTEIIGTIETVGTTPQATLDAAFPLAVSGDGVQDETTGNFWVYDGSTWTDVGTTPGPTTTPATVILPYNETAVYEGRLRLGNVVTKFEYALQLLTEVPALRTRINTQITPILKIEIPVTDIELTASAPTVESLAASISTVIMPFEYTGTGSEQSITGLFQPGIVFMRSLDTEDNSIYNYVCDAVRGNTKYWAFRREDEGEITKTESIKSFDSTGFTVGTDNLVNKLGSVYKGHVFRAPGLPEINNNGSITSLVAAGQAYSIITYTGNSSGWATIGHGLSTTPRMIWVKRLSDGPSNVIAGGPAIGDYYYMLPPYDNVRDFDGNFIRVADSSTFEVGFLDGVNQEGSRFVAYAFADVPGVSKIDTYEGDGDSAGQYVNCGFNVDFVLVKTLEDPDSTSSPWMMFDRTDKSGRRFYEIGGNEISTSANLMLFFEDRGMRVFGSGTQPLDFNRAGTTYLYMAFSYIRPTIEVPVIDVSLNAEIPSISAT